MVSRGKPIREPLVLERTLRILAGALVRDLGVGALLELTTTPAKPHVHGAIRNALVEHQTRDDMPTLVEDLDHVAFGQPQALGLHRIEPRGGRFSGKLHGDGIVGEA